MFLNLALCILIEAAGALANILYVPAGSVTWFDARLAPEMVLVNTVFSTLAVHAPATVSPPDVPLAFWS